MVGVMKTLTKSCPSPSTFAFCHYPSLPGVEKGAVTLTSGASGTSGTTCVEVPFADDSKEQICTADRPWDAVTTKRCDAAQPAYGDTSQSDSREVNVDELQVGVLEIQEPQEATNIAAPSLARGGAIESQPGAFTACPGTREVRQDAIEFSLLGRDVSVDTTATAVAAGSVNQEQPRLSEAVPVDDIEAGNLPGAIPVDHAAMEAKKSERDAQLKRLGMFGLLVILLVVIFTAVISSTVSEKNASAKSPIHVMATKVPTAPPIAASLSPTPAPSSLISSDMLLNTTIDAIQHPLSPQDKAHKWLLKHPHADNMSEWRKVQLFALATFFYSFHGEDWVDVVKSDFLVHNKSECDWYSGVYGNLLYNMWEQKFVFVEKETSETTCNNMSNFTKLRLLFPEIASKMESSMPPEIALLPEMEDIYLRMIGFNAPLEAAIIPEMKQLTNLRRMKLSNNKITGTIPDSLFDILPSSTLEELSLIEPDLSGTIPSRIQEFPNLQTLEMSGNFTGTIPSEIGLLSLLTSLSFSGNELLQDTIPSEVFNLATLERFSLVNTNISGTLATSVGQWKRLTDLQIDAQLSGTIPSSISELENLQICSLKGNNLVGTLPLISQMAPLERMFVSETQVTGPIPASWLPPSLKFLELNDNQLSGIVPESIWSHTNLETLKNLANNAGLSGQIFVHPNASFSELSFLAVSNNGFYGTIPFGPMKNSSGRLRSMLLDGNSFSGTLSSDIGSFTRMTDMRLSRNLELTGTIPTEISLCASLNSLQMDNTGISGSIPSELGLLTRLQYHSLHGTNLSGSVPMDVCMLKEEGRLVEIHVNCTAITCACNCTCS
ncbi:LRR receptor-like serine threonine-protein kinase [Seminavis robusta]|uniref:LRR receptor-like serine threonine-protein kinase n=1 Tax=Seminavis robusta TaxID=568900 RepID=A0A9N8ETD0_9STRA|nr:LRR receptor-like serine threonine-protein kinase [Seminavis robusta]|eukprot:Sro1631_g287240.1 LRR receptor-like serine threonine-protein kinase (833) ;mRNA; f:11199-13869